jgi:hypothetical protein
LEAGSHPGPPRLQCTFDRPSWAFVNLEAPLQTELAIDTNIVVVDTHGLVADAHMAVTNTETMVADMHRNMFTGQKDASDQNDSVGAICYSLTTERSPSPRLKPGQGY